MAFTNYDTKEINCKVIYFGASGAGKTANLRSIYSSTSAEVKSGLLEFSADLTPTSYFDFLPISLGHVNDFHVKLHLYTLPANPVYETVASVVLKGVDGYIFVADSRIEKMADNIEHLYACKKLLSVEGYSPIELPRVLQYNKRDLPGIVDANVLRRELNPSGTPDVEAVAVNSIGTMETLQEMARQILKRLAQ